MYKTLAKLPSRSTSDSLRKFIAQEYGCGGAAKKVVFSRTFTTSRRYDVLWFGAKATTKSMQMEIVEALRLGERSKASNLLSSLGHGSFSLRADDFVHILNYCARSPDPLFVMETWRVMEAKKIGLDNNCFLLMIRALCKGGYLDEAFNLINYLGEGHGIYPFLSIYNCFLGTCSKMQCMGHANQCLDLMDSRMVGKNEVTYSELLKLAVWQKNLPAVKEIWNESIKHYSLSMISLRKFIWSFTRLGDLKSACKTLQKMVVSAITEGSSVYRSAEGKLCSSRLDIPIPSKHEVGMKPRKSEHVQVGMLNVYTSKSAMKILRWSFSDVIHACAKLKNYGLAEQLTAQMQKLGLQPSSHTCDALIRAVVSKRGLSNGMELLKIMQRRNLKPYDSTLAILSIGCSKERKLGLAEVMLHQISECPNPHPFNDFFTACAELDQPERALQALAKMKHLKILPNITTYELLFSLFGNVNAPYEEGNMLSHVDVARRIKAIEMDMAKNGIQHSDLSMENLLKALGAEGMIRELIHYFHVAENLFSRSKGYLETSIYNTVLHSLVEAKESHMAIEVFKNMKSCGVSPNLATYIIMIDCCSILVCFKSACALLSLMLRDGYIPQTITFTALIKILLENEDFNESMSLLDQAISEGFQLDVTLFNTILRKARAKERIDVIEFVVARMISNKIRPDPSTCNFVFSTYVDRGFHSTAIEALQVLSMRMLCRKNGTFPNKKELNDFVVAEDSETEKLKIPQLFKDSKMDHAIALLNLRWSAMLGFPVSWLPSQSPWVKRLVSI
ncbi:hypothetical protein UlMin_033957 [Ulmus minor]